VVEPDRVVELVIRVVEPVETTGAGPPSSARVVEPGHLDVKLTRLARGFHASAAKVHV
jgi:hypothetical protein